MPDAKCEAKQGGGYPMSVTIECDGKVVWKGPQRELFRKYGAMRKASQEAIEKAVSAL
jgi:hypothetical protein